MKLGGEFIVHRKDGDIVLPNQFTIFGMQQVLAAAFQGLAQVWQCGLCAHNPGDNVALGELSEPSVGVNGYARANLPLDAVNWPIINMINGESYVQSRPFVFPATGPYDQSVNRQFLTDGSHVIAISSPLPEGLQIISENYTSSYRLYAR